MHPIKQVIFVNRCKRNSCEFQIQFSKKGNKYGNYSYKAVVQNAELEPLDYLEVAKIW